jgi:DNA-binding NarL/FixJ family response regulator
MKQALKVADHSEQLEILIRLHAVALAEGRKRRDQIRLLSAAGLPPKTIAELIGTTPNTVSVELSSIRREEGSVGARAKRAADERT